MAKSTILNCGTYYLHTPLHQENVARVTTGAAFETPHQSRWLLDAPLSERVKKLKALILRRPPTEIGLARLRQPKASKSATADFDWRPSRRMAAGTAEHVAILRDAPLKTGAPPDGASLFHTPDHHGRIHSRLKRSPWPPF